MTANTVNLIKLCVGIDSVEDLIAYRARTATKSGATNDEDITTHVTRMWPKRAGEILNGGSLYWVIKGVVQARQKIVRFDERIGTDGIRRCAIIMSPEIIRTLPAPRRPFQGWRYLTVDDSPPDLAQTNRRDDALPLEMQLALAEIGLR